MKTLFAFLKPYILKVAFSDLFGRSGSASLRRPAARYYSSVVSPSGIAARISNAKPAFALILLGLASVHSQEHNLNPDSLKVERLHEVVVQSVRAQSGTPMASTLVKAKDIAPRNLGQDIPQLLNFLPSVVTTSDAGTGIGYSSIRVRGSDATRVNVTINGIPYNDSESMGTFWVNMPDFASSAESIQLQRGVGTSTNGSGAFGASLNVLTDGISEKASGEFSNSFGSYNTRKHTVKFSTGMLGENFEFSGRLSNIKSDGYIDRASSDLKGYFLQGNYEKNATLIKALVFGGTEKTYQAWNGLEDPEKLANDRTYNTAGEYYDDAGNLRFYDNQTDNYKQDHYQLHWIQKFGAFWKSALGLHYTKGKGYYENYRQNRNVEDYGLEPVWSNGEMIDTSDLIDQKWLDNDFYGFTYSVNYKRDKVDAMLGGGWNEYQGDHFGKVIYARSVLLPQYGMEYYRDQAVKKEWNVFGRLNYAINSWASVFGDLQFRRVAYHANGDEIGFVRDRFNFFNPKAGFTAKLSDKSQLYISYARAHREPNRVDYENGSPRPERLDDFEGGWRFNSRILKLNINAYLMDYDNQLVLTGMLNDVGNPIRANSGSSYRVGLEIESAIQMTEHWSIFPNITLSRNKNREFYFQRDGVLQNMGSTNIAFSPDVIVGNAIVYRPLKPLHFSLFSKYVGKQYMGNIDSEVSRLDAYTTTDLGVGYVWENQSWFHTISIQALWNNLFNVKYISNGYFYTYEDTWSGPGVRTLEGAGYYPQATANFLIGLTLKF